MTIRITPSAPAHASHCFACDQGREAVRVTLQRVHMRATIRLCVACADDLERLLAAARDHLDTLASDDATP